MGFLPILLAGSILNSVSLTSSVDFTNHLGIQFKLIEPGTFYMGSCPRPSQSIPCLAKEGIDFDATRYEFPQHQVLIPKAFEISIYEITLEQFQAFLKAQLPALLTEDFKNYNEPHKPVVLVSWEDVQAFIKWLNQTKPSEDEGTYRLPNEAEWEYSARGQTRTIYWWGNEMRDNKANCQGCDNQLGPQQVMQVGSFPANPWGLYDVVGNVYEWVADCWNYNYTSAPIDGSTWRTGDCFAHVIRGGAWDSLPQLARVASRDWRLTNHRDFNLGFRLVREIPTRTYHYDYYYLDNPNDPK